MEKLYMNLLYLEYIMAALVFVILLFVTAPYGKFVRRGWGPTIPARAAWILQELPAFGVILIFFIQNRGWENPVTLIFLLVWQSHYFMRTFFYPFQMAGAQKPYPFMLVFFAWIFNTMNGFVNGYYVFQKATYDFSWLLSAPFIIGLIVFIFGYAMNKHSDWLLQQLRKTSDTYQIPYGGGFKWVSNPHYLGEILEWTGWGIMTWSAAGFAFAAFTFANLAPRGVKAHKWYKEEFPEYPKKRKAVIPWVW